MIANAIPVAIKQYSIAVAPERSAKNLEISCRIQNSRWRPQGDSAATHHRNLVIIGCEYLDEHAEGQVNRMGRNLCIWRWPRCPRDGIINPISRIRPEP